MYLLCLLLVPFAVAVASKVFGGRKVTWPEFLGHLAICLGVISLGGYLAYRGATADVEIWSGRVVKKQQEKVSCSHSYPCNCRMVSCGKNCQTMHCDTCYHHAYDWAWAVYTTDGGRIEIDRIDWRGDDMPPRWASVYIGEPSASQHRYTNYVKAAPDSILRRVSSDRQFKVPDYPTVFDYYRSVRVITDRVSMPDAKEWVWLIDQLNSDLGARKEVNFVVLVTRESDPDYEFAVERAWLGGKKNDVIVIIGAPSYPAISWARVVSWATGQAMKVKIRDGIEAVGDMRRRDEIVSLVRDATERHYTRRSMESLKYLSYSFRPGAGATAVLFVLGVSLSCLLGWITWNNDIEYDESDYGS